jgi:hypothetical protein
VQNKATIAIDGVFIDKESAMKWAQSGNYPGVTKDIVDAASASDGWESPPGLDGEQAKKMFMRQQLQVLLANPKHPFRFLIDSFQSML